MKSHGLFMIWVFFGSMTVKLFSSPSSENVTYNNTCKNACECMWVHIYIWVQTCAHFSQIHSNIHRHTWIMQTVLYDESFLHQISCIFKDSFRERRSEQNRMRQLTIRSSGHVRGSKVSSLEMPACRASWEAVQVSSLSLFLCVLPAAEWWSPPVSVLLSFVIILCAASSVCLMY